MGTIGYYKASTNSEVIDQAKKSKMALATTHEPVAITKTNGTAHKHSQRPHSSLNKPTSTAKKQ